MAEPPTGFEVDIGRAIGQALEELLTGKHLYQSVQLAFDLDLLRKVRIDPRSDTVQRFAATEQLRYLNSAWMPCWSESHSGVAEKAGWTRFSAPHIKIFCDHAIPSIPLSQHSRKELML
jgi:hypothetical protein